MEKCIYVALKPKTRVKISSLVVGGDFGVKTIDFDKSNGIHITDDIVEIKSLDIRGRNVKDVAKLSNKAIATIVNAAKFMKPAKQIDQKKEKEK